MKRLKEQLETTIVAASSSEALPWQEVDCMAAVDASAWDALLPDGYPFLRHAYLSALEQSESAGPAQGWQARHQLLWVGGALRAAIPLFEKNHSWGEFVFDWAWADAWARCGLNYYPKLVCAVPFAPVAGPRLLGSAPEAGVRLRSRCEQLGASSVHVLFAQEEDRACLQAAGFLQRQDCQYQWFNRDYRNFEEFLSSLTARRRKEIRRERRRVAESGLSFETLHGSAVDEALWAQLYPLYARTYQVRGQQPYLTAAFFTQLAASMGDAVVLFVARDPAGEPLAMAFCLRDEATLYGRHWGTAVEVDGLHFEACYYQGIDYCIAQGLQRYDAGVQGAHKQARGFEPVLSHSAHWIAEPGLRPAVQRFLSEEGEQVARYRDWRAERGPFRQAS